MKTRSEPSSNPVPRLCAAGITGNTEPGTGALVDALRRLDTAAATVALVDGQLKINGPAPLVAELGQALAANADLLVAVVVGRAGTMGPKPYQTTRHALAPCSACGELSMVGVTKDRVAGRTKWPACRMTPSCDGRHVPMPSDVPVSKAAA